LTAYLKQPLFRVFLIVIVIAVAFWAGMKWQVLIYEDKCLDMGGGRNPGNYPICVIDQANPPSKETPNQ